MDNKNNKHKKPLNPELIAAIFFAVFGFFFLLLTKFILLSLQYSAILPFFSALIVAILAGIFLGRLFGNALSKPRFWLYTFLLGIVMAIVALLFVSFSVFMHSYFYDMSLIHRLNRWQDYFVVYGSIFLTLFFIIGLWLMPLMGLAAIYFNKRFWPTMLSIDKLRFQSQDKSKGS